MRRLVFIWAFLDLCLLAAGVLSIVASVVFMSPDHLILSMIFEKIDFKFGIVLGALYILTCLLSIPAFLQPKDRPVLLKALNFMLIGVSAVTLAASDRPRDGVIGTVVWVFSLAQLANFSQLWATSSSEKQRALQDAFSCCGYWNGTAAGQFTTFEGFCSDTIAAASAPGCQPSITSSKSPGSDFTLENIFTSIYGLEVIIGMFFLATVCLIKEREVEVRFARIDEKRGGGGFV